MRTGGVTPTVEWFDTGVTCVGMGSKLITKEAIAQKDYASITDKCKIALERIKTCKS